MVSVTVECTTYDCFIVLCTDTYGRVRYLRDFVDIGMPRLGVLESPTAADAAKFDNRKDASDVVTKLHRERPKDGWRLTAWRFFVPPPPVEIPLPPVEPSPAAVAKKAKEEETAVRPEACVSCKPGKKKVPTNQVRVSDGTLQWMCERHRQRYMSRQLEEPPEIAKLLTKTRGPSYEGGGFSDSALPGHDVVSTVKRRLTIRERIHEGRAIPLPDDYITAGSDGCRHSARRE